MELKDIVFRDKIHPYTAEKIENRYGSYKNYQEEYINKLLAGDINKMWLPEGMKGIKYLDISEPDGVGKDYVYADLANDIFGTNYGFIVRKGSLEEVLNKAIKENLSDEHVYLLKKYYKLRDIKADAKFYIDRTNSKKEIMLKGNAITRLKKMAKSGYFNDKIILGERANEIIKEFLLENTVFYDELNINNEGREMLELLLLTDTVKNVEFFSVYQYQKKVKELEQKIKTSEKNDNEKNQLLEILNERKKAFVQENGDSIEKMIEQSINSDIGVNGSRNIINITLEDIKKSELAEEKIDRLVSLYQKKEAKKEQKKTLKNYEDMVLIGGKFPYLDIPVDQIITSFRISGCLKRAGIFSISDLVNKSLYELKNLEDIGKRVIEIAIERLKEVGFDIPKDKKISILEFNKDKVESVQKNDVEELKNQIINSELEEEQKSNLLSKLTKRAILDLQQEYEALNKIIRQNQNKMNYVISKAKIEASEPDLTKINTKIEDAKAKQDLIKSKIKQVSENQR